MIRASWLVGSMVAFGAAALPARARAEPAHGDTDAVAATRAADVDAAAATRDADADALAAAAGKLMAQGRYDEGCDKYERSQRIDPTARRTIKVAECNERRGRTASSWVAFSQALDMADEAEDRPAGRVARDGVERIEANLAKIEVVVSEETSRLPGLEVRRDGHLVPAAVFGVPVPVDPGQHFITASAPNRLPWSVQIGIARAPAALSIVIPMLEPAPLAERRDAPGRDGVLVNPFGARDPMPTDGAADGHASPAGEGARASALAAAAAAPAPVGSGARSLGSAQRAVGWALGGAGLAALTVGVALGIDAAATRDDLDAICPGTCPSSQAAAQAAAWHDRYQSQATTSTVLIGLGITSLAAGFVVYITSPSEKPSSARAGALQFAPAIAKGSAGFVAAGAFQ